MTRTLDAAKAMIDGKLPQAPVAKLIGFELVAQRRNVHAQIVMALDIGRAPHLLE